MRQLWGTMVDQTVSPLKLPWRHRAFFVAGLVGRLLYTLRVIGHSVGDYRCQVPCMGYEGNAFYGLSTSLRWGEDCC
jgi:hypothetical protein